MCIFVVEAIGHKIYPVPGETVNTKEALRRFIKTLPIGALLTVELGYVIGSVSGGFVIGKMAVSNATQLAIGLGGLLTLFGIQNLVMIPHPTWFAVLTSVTYIPGTYVGARLSGV